jgi:DNA-binding response OmpR family regulator
MTDKTPPERSGDDAPDIEARASEGEGAEETRSGRGPTVLLIDSEPMLRALTSRLLSRHGASVTIASLPCDAALQARARAFDVVVVDLDVPGATGVMALLAGGATAPQRLVACTSRPLDAAESEVCAVVLAKPFDFNALAAAVLGRTPRHRQRRRHRATPARHTLMTRRRAARSRLDRSPRSADDRSR